MRDDARAPLFIRRREARERLRALTPARRARRDDTCRCASVVTAPSLRPNNFRREVGNCCASFVFVCQWRVRPATPRLASRSVRRPEAIPAPQGTLRRAGQRIGPRRAKRAFGARRAPKSFGGLFGGRDWRCSHPPLVASWLWAELLVYCLLLYVAAAEQLSS